MVEIRGDGAPPICVPARSSRDYKRTKSARTKTRLTRKLKTSRKRLKAATHAKHGVRRKVRRRDAQIARERDSHAGREERMRADLRVARRAARVADRARDKAVTYAETQERARDAAEQKAAAEARARADLEAEVQRLRTELLALRSAQTQPRVRPDRPKALPVAVIQPASPAPPVPASSPPRPLAAPPTRPNAAPPSITPSPVDGRLREQLAQQERTRAVERAEARAALTRMERLLRQSRAERDVARAASAQYKTLLGGVALTMGGVAVLARLAQRTSTITMPSTTPAPRPASAHEGQQVRPTFTVTRWEVATRYHGTKAQHDAWSGQPFDLSLRGGRFAGSSSS